MMRRRKVLLVLAAFSGCEPSNSDYVVSDAVTTLLLGTAPSSLEISLSVDGPRTDLTVSDVRIVSNELTGEADERFTVSLDCGDYGEKSVERRVGDPLDEYDTLLTKSVGADAPVDVSCDISFVRVPPISGDVELRWQAELSAVWESDAKLELGVTIAED